jgi:hypothetical protein
MKPQPDLSRENQSENPATPHSPGPSEASGIPSGDSSSRAVSNESPWWQADWFRRWERLAKREG